MNWLDAVIIGALVVGAVYGVNRGLGWTAFRAGGAVGGVLAAYVWGGDVAAFLGGRVPLPEWLAVPLAVVLLAVGLHVAGYALSRGWSRWMAGSAVGRWDRWAGAAAGVALAAFACSVLLLMWIEWPGRPFPEAVEHSAVARRLLQALPAVYRRIDWILAPLRSSSSL